MAIVEAQDPLPRYCSTCGAKFPPEAGACRTCGARRVAPADFETPAAIAVLIEEIDAWRAAGLLDDASAERLRDHYARRREQLLAARGEARGAPGGTRGAAAARAASAAAGAAPAARPRGVSVGEWAAHRQADVLLYVGAFLLVISALIFTTTQGEALSGAWRVGVLAAYTGAFTLAGLLLSRWPRVREAGPVFLAIGALITPLNFLLLQTEVLGDRDVPGSVVWFAGSAYSALLYALLHRRGFGRLYAVPAALALLSAWLSLADAVGLPFQWGGAWWMAFALAAAGGLSRTRRLSRATGIPVVTFAVLALLLAVGIAWDDYEPLWQLPVTCALATALAVVLAASLRRPAAYGVAAVLALAAALASVWAAGLPPQWFGAPPLAGAALLLLARSPRGGSEAWPGASLLGAAWLLAPLALLGAHLDGDSAGAAASFLAVSAVAAAAALPQTAVIPAAWFPPGDAAGRGPRSRERALERVALSWLGFASLLIAVGFAQRGLEIARPETALAFAALGAATSGVIAVSARRAPGALWAGVPLLLLVTAVSVQHPVDRFAGHNAALLALPAAHLLLVSGLLRRLAPAALATALGMLALASLWESREWAWWSLSPAYAGIGVLLLAALTPRRRYGAPPAGGEEAAAAAHALSWLPLGAAVLTAALALAGRLGGAAVEATSTAEYRALVLMVLLLAPLIALESFRLRRWEPALLAWAVALAGAAALWPVGDWPLWTLAAWYSLAGAAAFRALAPWRRAPASSAARAVQGISWSGLALGPLAALVALDLRLGATGAGAASLVEFRVLAASLLPLAAAVAYEGRRLGIRWAALPSSALLMLALELAIATLGPGNVQAYTVPAALYLASVGLLARSSEPLSRHLGWHELLQLAGAALLVLPQAEQGFDPGGARWGLVLLLEGLALLAVSMALGARWLGVSAVVTLSGVALRFLWVTRVDPAVPYWVMLALVGFLLLGVGLTVLLHREWWDRRRLRLQAWWRREDAPGGRLVVDVPAAALLTALLPVLAVPGLAEAA